MRKRRISDNSSPLIPTWLRGNQGGDGVPENPVIGIVESNRKDLDSGCLYYYYHYYYWPFFFSPYRSKSNKGSYRSTLVKEGTMVGWIVLGVIVLIALWAVAIFNKLVKNRNLVLEGWSGIDMMNVRILSTCLRDN